MLEGGGEEGGQVMDYRGGQSGGLHGDGQERRGETMEADLKAFSYYCNGQVYSTS